MKKIGIEDWLILQLRIDKIEKKLGLNKSFKKRYWCSWYGYSKPKKCIKKVTKKCEYYNSYCNIPLCEGIEQ